MCAKQLPGLVVKHSSYGRSSIFRTTVIYVLSTMGVSKESISKFLIGNRFHIKLRIRSPYSNRIIFE